ncbi:hypothetical protein DAI18_07095 [Microvirgula aerodenitrificans]|uniref:Uncharacterized protein n=1 Tax=Microvirgula aerodenitrificans TaxID=57480 RepID=A0A2S0P8Z9_9NEIS|nr:hypothetical protein [Microvirgula aerodenitrificans]AVY93836.1 hypothetical protein DAI18_07095 [Microvirgula aerodenitrificans]
MPIPPAMSLLSALAARHEWDGVQKCLSLADMGRLCLVSPALREVVTPGMLDRAALDLIRCRETGGVAGGDLCGLRFHPAAQRFVDTEHYAAASIASLHYVWKDACHGRCQASTTAVQWLMGMLAPSAASTRSGGISVTLSTTSMSGMAQDLHYFIAGGQASPLRFPGSLKFPPRQCSLQLNTSRDYVLDTPAHWLLKDGSNRLYAYAAASEEAVPLPMEWDHGATVAMSRSGRFAIAVSTPEGGISTLHCHDRLQDASRVTTIASGDYPICQAAVTDQGRAYVASHQSGHVTGEQGEAEMHAFSDSRQSLFMLSPDERFLIRSRYSSLHGDLVLLDLQDSREVILPRLAGYLPWGASIRPMSVAFSVLNMLAAVLYDDGAVHLFNLHRAEAQAESVVLGTVPMSPGSSATQPYIGFDGFDRIHVVYQVQTESGVVLEMQTLHIAAAGVH